MRLLGVRNDTHFIASVARHDYRTSDNHELTADGGQPYTPHASGYNRLYGDVCWVRVEQTMADLLNDYYQKKDAPRKYGKWDLKDVTILKEHEYPHPSKWDTQLENAYWGTYGIDGKQPFKYIMLEDAETSHLKAILETTEHLGSQYKKIIEKILQLREQL